MSTRRRSQGRFEQWLRQAALGPAILRMEPVVHAAAWLWRRLMVRTTFVAVTGAVGKTTTKDATAAFLEAAGVTYHQGFLFGQPVTVEELEQEGAL